MKRMKPHQYRMYCFSGSTYPNFITVIPTYIFLNVLLMTILCSLRLSLDAQLFLSPCQLNERLLSRCHELVFTFAEYAIIVQVYFAAAYTTTLIVWLMPPRLVAPMRRIYVNPYRIRLMCNK